MAILLIVGVVGVAFVGLIGIVGFVFMSSANSQRALTTEEAKALDNGSANVDILTATIESVRQGGLITVEGLFGEPGSTNLIIDDYNFCKIGSGGWHELISVNDNQNLAIETHLKSSGNEYFQVRIHQGQSLESLGLSEDGLKDLSADKSVEFGERSYQFDKSGEALFHKTEGAFGRKCEFWFFRSGETAFLRVEKRPDFDGFRITTGELMAPNAFQVLKIRGA